MKNIAITGGSGFIGTLLVEKLKQMRVSYTFLDRKKHNLLYPNSLKDFVSSKDIIIHLAAKDKDSGLAEMMKTNIGGTLGLMEAIKQWNPSVKLIVASSFLVYLPDDMFGATKKAAEELIEEYGKQLPIKVTMLRFSNIFGPGGKPFHNSVISTFVHLIKKGKEITITGDGSQKRDFVHINDIVQAIIAAMDYNPVGIEYFDVCTGTLTSLNDLIKILASHTKKKIHVTYDTSIQNFPYSLQKNYLSAKEKLSWKPKITLAEGLKTVW